MATAQGTIEYILDQLAGLKDVRARKMFGEYALYYQDKVVALVCDDEVYLKITPEGKKLIGCRYEEGFAYPGAKPSMHIPGDLLEDPRFFCELVAATARALPLSKPKSRKKLTK